jgi:hypothetical protein
LLRPALGEGAAAEPAADPAGQNEATEQGAIDVPQGQWAIPDAAAVNTSAACTLALAVAGRTPRLGRIAAEVRPSAMPMAPSTSCAAKPTATNRTS